MMKHDLFKIAFVSFGFGLLLPFQNCGKHQTLDEDNFSSEVPVVQEPEKPLVTVTAPLDAKQTLESMLALVGVSTTEMNRAEVNSEINYRRNLLVPTNEIKLVSSPSIIATTSLAAVVCKQAVTKEKAGTKDMFKTLDFKKGPGSYGQKGALNTLLVMADRFWLRNPTSDEMIIFNQTIQEYYQTLTPAALSSAAETDKLAIFLCTGMLASPDSYTL